MIQKMIVALILGIALSELPFFASKQILPASFFHKLQDTTCFWRARLTNEYSDYLQTLNDNQAYRHLVKMYYQTEWEVEIKENQIQSSKETTLPLYNYGVVKQVAIEIDGKNVSHGFSQGTLLWSKERQEIVFMHARSFQLQPIYLNPSNAFLMCIRYERAVGLFYSFIFIHGRFELAVSSESEETPPIYLAQQGSCKQYKDKSLQLYNKDLDHDGILDFGFKGTLFDYCGEVRMRDERDSIPYKSCPIDFYYLLKLGADQKVQFIPFHAKEISNVLGDNEMNCPN